MGLDYSGIECRVCKRPGGIRATKIHRLSGPAVVIGYIFLIPSALGIVLGMIMGFSTCAATKSTTDGVDKEYKEQIAMVGGLTKEQQAELIGATSEPTRETLAASGLNEEQIQKVDLAWTRRAAGKVGSGLGAGVAGVITIVIIVVSFVGGLLGWLLTNLTGPGTS